MDEDPAPAASGLCLVVCPSPGSRIDASFQLAEPGTADLAVYNAIGRRVATLAHGRFPAGLFVSRAWDGLTLRHGIAADGVYFIRLSTPGAARATKVVLRK